MVIVAHLGLSKGVMMRKGLSVSISNMELSKGLMVGIGLRVN